MQLDSKESDIEQLREKLNDLQQRMDNSSVTSLQTDETDSNIAGKVTVSGHLAMLTLLITLWTNAILITKLSWLMQHVFLCWLFTLAFLITFPVHFLYS